MSPIPTPFNPGDLGGKIVGAATTAAAAVNSVAPVVTSAAPQATKIAGDAAPVLADVAKNAAGGFDLEKMAKELAMLKFNEYLELAKNYMKEVWKSNRGFLQFIMLVLIVLLWRQLSRWIAQLCGAWVYYRTRKQGKKWLRTEVPFPKKDHDNAWEKVQGKVRAFTDEAELEARKAILAQRLANVNGLFQEKPIPDFDLCRASRLRTDLEKDCRFNGSIASTLKRPLKRFLYYVGLWWIADFRADKDRYKRIFDKSVS